MRNENLYGAMVESGILHMVLSLASRETNAKIIQFDNRGGGLTAIAH